MSRYIKVLLDEITYNETLKVNVLTRNKTLGQTINELLAAYFELPSEHNRPSRCIDCGKTEAKLREEGIVFVVGKLRHDGLCAECVLDFMKAAFPDA